MALIRLSIPGAPKNADLSQYLGNAENRLGSHKIFVNADISECDAWFVIDSPDNALEQCLVTHGSVVHLTAETLLEPGHFESSANRRIFLDQFDEIHTCHDIFRSNVTTSLPFLPWMINANHGNSIWSRHERDVNKLLSIQSIEKSQTLSVICSSKASNPQHAMRLRFVKAIKNHFGTRIDWFGNGVRPIEEKWFGLSPYKYTIVLENGSSPNVITEKLFDSLLSLTYPIYWGAPNAGEFFPSDSYAPINIKDLNGSIAVIEKILDEDNYQRVLPSLRTAKNLVLTDYMFLNRIGEITDRLIQENAKYGKKWVSIRSTRRLGLKSFSGSIQNTKEYSGMLRRRFSRDMS